MRLKLQCQSMTRQSNYTVQCRARGIMCKNGNVRCKNHGGKSTGPTSPAGRLKSLQNLKQFHDKRITINRSDFQQHHSTIDEWNSSD